jgi:putative addiction module killer protein
MIDANHFKIVFYETENGRVPFDDWLSGLKDIRGKLAVEGRLGRLRDGNPGDCKYFDDLMEMRIDYGPGYRIYCAKKEKTFIVILIGGAKKGQSRDIEKAKEYWADYQKRVSRQHSIRSLPLPRPKG